MTKITGKKKSVQRTPYPLRLDADVYAKAKDESEKEERSLNWIINRKLQEIYGLREKASTESQ